MKVTLYEYFPFSCPDLTLEFAIHVMKKGNEPSEPSMPPGAVQSLTIDLTITDVTEFMFQNFKQRHQFLVCFLATLAAQTQWFATEESS